VSSHSSARLWLRWPHLRKLLLCRQSQCVYQLQRQLHRYTFFLLFFSCLDIEILTFIFPFLFFVVAPTCLHNNDCVQTNGGQYCRYDVGQCGVRGSVLASPLAVIRTGLPFVAAMDIIISTHAWLASTTRPFGTTQYVIINPQQLVPTSRLVIGACTVFRM